MCSMIVQIIAIILSVIIAVLALSIGGYPTVLNVLRHLRFPPARFHFNALLGIEKLESLDENRPDEKGNPIRVGVVRPKDAGFKELIDILRENRLLIVDVDEIMLAEIEINAGVATFRGNIPLTPQKMRVLGVVKNEQYTEIRRELYDPTRTTRDLKIHAEEIVRRRVAKWILVALALYLAASITLVVIR